MYLLFPFCVFTLHTENPSDAKRAKVDRDAQTIKKLLDSIAKDSSRRKSLDADKEDEVPNVKIYARATLGTHLKFVNREKSINTLLMHVKEQYDVYIAPEPAPEKSVRLAACSGGPGLGKTTFCRKAFTKAADASGDEKEVIWEGVDESFKTVVETCVAKGRQFRISFGGSPPLGSELHSDHYAIVQRMTIYCKRWWEQSQEIARR
jgi:hypothetical protein